LHLHSFIIDRADANLHLSRIGAQIACRFPQKLGLLLLAPVAAKAGDNPK
jgi:hypothetical protein